MGVPAKEVVVDTIKVIGVYRFIIDGAVILALAGMLWTISGWKTSIEAVTASNREANKTLADRVEKLENKTNTLESMPITKEADARIRILETAMTAQFSSIDQRLNRMEGKLDRMDK